MAMATAAAATDPRCTFYPELTSKVCMRLGYRRCLFPLQRYFTHTDVASCDGLELVRTEILGRKDMYATFDPVCMSAVRVLTVQSTNEKLSSLMIRCGELTLERACEWSEEDFILPYAAQQLIFFLLFALP